MPARAQSWRAGLRPHRLVQCHAPGSGGLPGGSYVLASVEDRREFFWIARGRRPLPPVRWNSRSSCLTRWRSCWAFPARAAHGPPRPVIASRFRRIQLRHIAHALDTRADVVRRPCTAPPLHASPSGTRARLRRSNAASPRAFRCAAPGQAATCTHARAQCHSQGRSPNGYYCAGGRPSTMNERVVATACLTGLILS